MPLKTVIISALIFLWALLKEWILIFIRPFMGSSSLWIIVPIWLVWFFAEFFQEKEGTSFGNAISNGIVPVYVGIDWLRYITTSLVSHKAGFGFMMAGKYLLALLAITYGLTIIIYGIKAKKFIQYFGRIREVTYVLLVFTPVIYELIVPTYKYFISIVLFFPLFYFAIEFIDKYTPAPEIFKYDKGKKEENFKREY